MGITKNELVIGVPYEQYAAEPGFRASWLNKLKISPQHFLAMKNQEDEDTPAKRLGRLIHSVFENGEKFMDTYIVEPKFTGKTKDGKESARSGEAIQAKKDWYASLDAEAVVVTSEELEVLVGIANQVKNSRLLTNMLKGSVRESSLWVDDPETGVLLQCRPDFVTASGYIVDIKSTRQNARDFPGDIFSDKYGKRFYVLSAAHYVHCARVAKLSKTDSITLLAVETHAPFGFIPYVLDIGCLGPGEQWRSHLMSIYAECLKTGVWPGYPDEVQGLVPPEYVSLPVNLNDAEL
jgi:hypothetical protein